MLFKLAESLITVAVSEAARGILRTLNGVRLVATDDFSTGESSPYRLIINQRLLKLRRYISRRRSRSRIPVLLIPPLMVRPDIYDLHPSRSLIRELLACGYDVFLLDFGSPLRKDHHLSLDDYVTKKIHRAVRKVKTLTRHKELSLIGYCLGGVFANLYAAVFPQEGVRNVVSLGAPADFSTMPVYHAVAQILEKPFFSLAETYKFIPAPICRLMFQLSQPLKTVLRPLKLAWNLWDEDYVSKQQSVSRWMDDFVNLPRASFEQLWTVFQQNSFYSGDLEIGGEKLDWNQFRASALSIAGENDHLISPECVASLLDVIPSGDKTFELVPGGHLGILIGSQAQETWDCVTDWLLLRSRAEKILRFRRTKDKKGGTPPVSQPNKVVTLISERQEHSPIFMP